MPQPPKPQPPAPRAPAPQALWPDVRRFLQTRRSRPLKLLAAPVPDRAELRALLEMAARSPDHGKLEPWRFIVLERADLARLAHAATARATEAGHGPDDKAAAQFAGSPLAVAVIAVPRAHPKIPEIEQLYSAGAVCLALLNAALASGWGANWLSGWLAHDRAFVQSALGLAPHEQVAGFIHIGTADTPPPERPRPDLEAITRWGLS